MFFFVVAAIAILLAIFFKGNFREIWFVLGSYMSACLLIPMLFGHIWPRRISDNLFTFSAICCAGLITVWNLIPKSGIWQEVNGFYIGIVFNLLTLGFAILKTRNTNENRK